MPAWWVDAAHQTLCEEACMPGGDAVLGKFILNIMVEVESKHGYLHYKLTNITLCLHENTTIIRDGEGNS